MYIRKDLKKYIDDLASRNSVPGGGSAAALAGAIGTALSSMVANFTLAGIQYKSEHRRMKQLLKKNESLRKKIQILIDKDVVVFLKLQDVMKIPKVCSQRATLTQKGLKEAANIPYEICCLCREAMGLTEHIARIGNINLISDSGGAAYLLDAAFKSAELNVKINLKYIKDKRFISKKKKALKIMSAFMAKIKKCLINKIESRL
ncbi:MAG: cyclodeaminase/cyclohydrolase family protein [Candidatus Omnitrophica bacterium]|nr:cyclodeaminase/cyclohydrolase family protein [Candidatus Omnitrophota bacterium]